MTREYRITKHALWQFRRRICECSQREAYDQLQHACSISRLPTSRELRIITGRGNSREPRSFGLTAYRVCQVENIVLACRRDGEILVVLTVYRLPSKAAKLVG